MKGKVHTQSQRHRIKAIMSSRAKMPEWFKKLSPKAKLAYIEAHPNSKLAKGKTAAAKNTGYKKKAGPAKNSKEERARLFRNALARKKRATLKRNPGMTFDKAMDKETRALKKSMGWL